MSLTPQEAAEMGMWLSGNRRRHVRIFWAAKLWTVEFWEGAKRVSANQATDLRAAIVNTPDTAKWEEPSK